MFKGIADFRPTRIAMLRAETTAGLTAIIEQARQMLARRDNTQAQQ